MGIETSTHAKEGHKQSQKSVDKIKNIITKEEYNEDAERYRDKKSKKFTRGPKHNDEDE